MNLASVIEGHPPDRTAVLVEDRVWTYGQLRDQVSAMRAALRAAGTTAGDRVAIICGNTLSFVVCYFGVIGAGAVAVPLNPSAPVPELQRQLGQLDAAATLIEQDALVADDSTGLEGVGGSLLEVVQDRGSGEVRRGDERASGELRGGSVPDSGPLDMQGSDLAVMLFTSGTAGAPRAACLTHSNLVSNLEQIQQHPALAVRPDDVALGALPLFHVFGLGVVLGATMQAGASLVLVEHFTPLLALELIQRHRVTLVAGVPSMFESMARAPGVTGSELSSVRCAVSGAAPLPEDVQRDFSDRFGMELWQGYGLTEAAPVVTSSLVGGRPTPGSIGMPLDGLEVRLVDPDGADTLVGDPGEIWVRGPNVFAGYLNDPEATRSVVTEDGWLRTGDIAVMDDNGDLFLVDRRKDLIIVSGFNVFPAEVEEVLTEHPAIADAAVVGVPDPVSGQSVTAVVVREPGRTIDERAVIEHCARHLARYKCPREVGFTEQLPRGPAGKLLRRRLEQRPNTTI